MNITWGGGPRGDSNISANMYLKNDQCFNTMIRNFGGIKVNISLNAGNIFNYMMAKVELGNEYFSLVMNGSNLAHTKFLKNVW